MAQYQLGAPRSDGETFFLVLTYNWQKYVAKISKVLRTQRKMNSARAKTLLNKLLNLNCRGLGPLVEHVQLRLVIFMTKQISPSKIVELIIIFC